jgi:uncharacterized membrane protein
MNNYLIFTVILLAFSFLYLIFNPSEISKYWGYRTFQSMKSVSNWKYANKLASMIFLVITSILFIIVLISNCYNLKLEKYIIGLLGIGIIFMFVLVEIKLKYKK